MDGMVIDKWWIWDWAQKVGVYCVESIRLKLNYGFREASLVLLCHTCRVSIWSYVWIEGDKMRVEERTMNDD